MIEAVTAFVVGGETIEVPPMTFYCLERAWPHVSGFADAGGDTFRMVNEAVAIVAAATLLFSKPWSADDIKKRLAYPEVGAFLVTVPKLLAASGLNTEGEAGGAPASGAEPVPLISPPLPPSSSPAASKAEAGTLSNAA